MLNCDLAPQYLAPVFNPHEVVGELASRRSILIYSACPEHVSRLVANCNSNWTEVRHAFPARLKHPSGALMYSVGNMSGQAPLYRGRAFASIYVIGEIDRFIRDIIAATKASEE